MSVKNFFNFNVKNKLAIIFASLLILQSCSGGNENLDDQYQDQQNYDIVNNSSPQSDSNFALNQANQTPPNSTINQPASNQNTILKSLSLEYKNIADMFLVKNGEKQSDYFQSKSSDIIQNQFIEYEIVPNDMLESTKDPRLSNLMEKENFVKNNLSKSNDDILNAKLIANYDCAVVDVIESIAAGTQELTTCYDDLNTMALAIAPVAKPEAAIQQNSDTKNTSQIKESNDKFVVLAKLKPYTEQVNKVFSVIEFDKESQSVDISYYEHFKSIGNTTSSYNGNYKITIVGYQLYDESPYKTIKLKKGRTKQVKRSSKAVKASQTVNNMLKARALTVRKMLVTNGVDDSKIVIAHPDSDKVKFLYNIKDGPQGQNILENIIIVDIKLDESQDSNLSK